MEWSEEDRWARHARTAHYKVQALLPSQVVDALLLHTEPEGSKYPNMKYIPQTIVPIPSSKTIDTPPLGPLDLRGMDPEADARGIPIRFCFRSPRLCFRKPC